MTRKTINNEPRKADVAWRDHEQLPESAQVHAKKLIDESGSPELAKKVVDAVHQREQAPPATKDDLAKQLGFVSYLDMFEASTPVPTLDNKSWYVTNKEKQWIAWNEQALTPRKFDSRSAAVEFIERTSGRAGKKRTDEAYEQG